MRKIKKYNYGGTTGVNYDDLQNMYANNTTWGASSIPIGNVAPPSGLLLKNYMSSQVAPKIERPAFKKPDTKTSGFTDWVNKNNGQINQLGGIIGSAAQAAARQGSTTTGSDFLHGVAGISDSLPGSWAGSLGEGIGSAVSGADKNRIRGVGSAIGETVGNIAGMFGPVGKAFNAGINLLDSAFAKDTINGIDLNTGSGYKDYGADSAKKDGSYGLFDRIGGGLKKANKQIAKNNAFETQANKIFEEGLFRRSSSSAQELASQNQRKYLGYGAGITYGKKGAKIPELEATRKLLQLLFAKPTRKFEHGGKIEKNVIVEGALHARKHDLESKNPDLNGNITSKGIPVITHGEGGIVQTAEVETGEIIFTKAVTEELDILYNAGSEEAMIEAGKLLVKQIMKNTIDKTKEVL